MCMGHLHVRPLNMPTLRMPTLANPDPFPLHPLDFRSRSPLEIPESVLSKMLQPVVLKKYTHPMLNVPFDPKPDPPIQESFHEWCARIMRELKI